MCGINGIFNYRSTSKSVSKSELEIVRDSMVSRGPDGAGLWISDNQHVGLAHRRLSIIDLNERANQPLFTQDGQLGIVFNGEIYNYQLLRQNLEKKGYTFQTTSDTEVLLHLYRDQGEAMVHALRGMFAFAIWDEKKQTLFLARDPFGIKPLYYADDGKTFRFASSVKALKAGGNINTNLESAAQISFLLMGYVLEPWTWYEGIEALPAGCMAILQQNKPPQITRYFDFHQLVLEQQQNSLSISSEQKKEILHDVLLGSVKSHLIADVPVGIFLSAGLDSTSILGFAKEAGYSNLQAITLGFSEFNGTLHDEVPLAKQVAEHFGAQHHISHLGKDNFSKDLNHILQSMDQPSIDGVNTYFVSQAAAKQGFKVAISGLGGDELFGGYPSFKQLPKLHNQLKYLSLFTKFGKQIRLLTSPIIKRFTSPKYASLFEYGDSISNLYFLRRSLFMPWELPNIIDPDIVKDGWQKLNLLSEFAKPTEDIQSEKMQISLLETLFYMRNQLLRDSDWAGMAHSLEIRVPLVDVNLYQQLLPLMLSNSSVSKLDMANCLQMPQEILSRKKTGFATPVNRWINELSSNQKNERGLRGWSKYLLQEFSK